MHADRRLPGRAKEVRRSGHRHCGRIRNAAGRGRNTRLLIRRRRGQVLRRPVERLHKGRGQPELRGRDVAVNNGTVQSGNREH